MLRSLRPWILALSLVAAAPTLSRAQEPTPADTARGQLPPAEMNQQMEQMQGMMASVMRNVTQSTMEALADPETARNLARFTRNYYNALVEEGFTEEQALRIVSSMGFPTVPRM